MSVLLDGFLALIRQLNRISVHGCGLVGAGGGSGLAAGCTLGLLSLRESVTTVEILDLDGLDIASTFEGLIVLDTVGIHFVVQKESDGLIRVVHDGYALESQNITLSKVCEVKRAALRQFKSCPMPHA